MRNTGSLTWEADIWGKIRKQSTHFTAKLFTDLLAAHPTDSYKPA